MKKVFLTILISVVLVCTSCQKTIDNISSSFTDDSSISVVGTSEIEKELTKYFYNNFSVDDIGILADITCDDIADLITVKKDDRIIYGNVYSVVGNKVKCIEEKIGAYDHAGGFFNWYLNEMDSGYCLVEENTGMWQGIGTCETVVYNLTSGGKRVEKSRVSVTSDAPVSDEEYDKYRDSISNIIGNSYDILHTFSESKRQPKGMKEDLLLKMPGITASSSNIISSQTDVKNGKALKTGKYQGKTGDEGIQDIYANITLDSNNSFLLEANIELNNFKKGKPFSRMGTYKYEVSESDDTYGSSTLCTWLKLYFDNELYWTYAVVDDKTFQDQVLVFKLA